LQERTSYGFLAALSGVKPVAIAQQGKTDYGLKIITVKKLLQYYAFKKSRFNSCLGPVMTK
jgi:hypothetical protein